jgi:hypothetical protein
MNCQKNKRNGERGEQYGIKSQAGTNRTKGIFRTASESPKINKDTILKKLRANIEAINARLKTIAGYEEKTAELAKTKAEKAASQKDPENSKEKKAKEAPVEGKEKKKKKGLAVP